MSPTTTHEIQIRVADLPEVQEAFEALVLEIEQLKTERDEWEERYEWLLERVGGVAP